ncbi:MAG TPA: hypothetical protein VGS27_14820 [Candidatus Sulfotelmatobacter sp.]|nr:hypothetical protein [Candidatus Sulfotelmatobacter sp.]
MHGAWYILRWAWSAILIAYLLLYVVTEKRLAGHAKNRSGATFWVVAVLAVLRMLGWYVLRGGLIYQLAVMLVGIAAGFAALDLTRMLVEQKPKGRITDARTMNGGR